MNKKTRYYTLITILVSVTVIFFFWERKVESPVRDNNSTNIEEENSDISKDVFYWDKYQVQSTDDSVSLSSNKTEMFELLIIENDRLKLELISEETSEVEDCEPNIPCEVDFREQVLIVDSKNLRNIKLADLELFIFESLGYEEQVELETVNLAPIEITETQYSFRSLFKTDNGEYLYYLSRGDRIYSSFITVQDQESDVDINEVNKLIQDIEFESV